MAAIKSDSWLAKLKRLPKSTILRGMNLCLKNAKSLLKESQSLHELRASNRSFVLSALALEETGKVVFLTLFSHSDSLHLSDKSLKKIWNKFRNHKTKTILALHHAWKAVLYVRRKKHVPSAEGEASYKRLLRAHRLVSSFMGQARVESIADLKLLSLYVDFSNGKFHQPPKVPLKVSGALIEITGSGVEDARRLRDTFRRARADSLAEAIMMVMFRSETLHETVRLLEEAGNAIN